MLNTTDRTVVVIDGPSLYYSTLGSGVPAVNFLKMREYFAEKSNLMNIFYFNLFPKGERTALHKVVDFMMHNGFVCRVPSTDFIVGDDGKRHPSLSVKDFVLEALDNIVDSTQIEQVVLIGHNKFYEKALRDLQFSGKRTVLIGTRKSEPPKVTLSLLSAAGNFMELYDMPFWVNETREDENKNG